MFLDKKYLKKIIVSLDSNILEVIRNLNASEIKIVLVVDKNKNFVGVINDGDIRRAFSKGYNLKDSIKLILNKEPFIVHTIEEINQLSNHTLNTFIHIPIIQNNKIRTLYVADLFLNRLSKKKHNYNIVIMAGGFGKRLGYLTKQCPKALLKFNGQPLLKYILQHIKKNNFYNVFISVFYLKKMIKDFIYNNDSFSLNIKFIEEKYPLGTIGSIRLIKNITTDFIVMNCDVISDVDLSELIKFHKKRKSILTIATKHFQYKNPYGVVISRANKFISFKEKPEIDFSINSGIYVFNKKVITIMNRLNINNIETLIMMLKKKKYKVFTYPLIENWRDLGSDKDNLKKY
jgi:dTDP-glucose pyrophosphorylase/CBS domain-containing protein